jgi:hypothetical protein
VAGKASSLSLSLSLSPTTLNNNNNNKPKNQYFGSNDGTFRTYPAKRWSSDAADQCVGATREYDPRFRPWFVSSATGPKDILVCGCSVVVWLLFGVVWCCCLVMMMMMMLLLLF